MRRIFLLLAIFCLHVGAVSAQGFGLGTWAASYVSPGSCSVGTPTYVQGKALANGSGSVNTLSLTLTSPVGNCDTLFVTFSYGGNAQSATCTDDKSNSYQSVDAKTQSGYTLSTFWLPVITNGPQTVTCNLGTSVTYVTLEAEDISGLGKALLDQHTINPQFNVTSSNGVTSGSVTTTGADFVWGTAVFENASSVSVGTGFTLGLSTSSQWFTEHLTQGSAGAVAATYTNTTANTNSVTAIIAVTPGAGTAPVALTAPTFSETPLTTDVVGNNLSVTSAGTFSGASSVTYNWNECSTTPCSPSNGIQIGAGNYYPLQTYDAGKYVSLSSVGSNIYGTTYNTSATTVLISNPAIATNIGSPSIYGNAVVGATLFALPGAWSAVPTPTYTYKWHYSGSGVSLGAQQFYVPVSGDVGNPIEVDVSVTNAGGTSSVITSAATSSVVANTQSTAGCGGWASDSYYDGCAGAPAAQPAGFTGCPGTQTPLYTVQCPNFFSTTALSLLTSYPTSPPLVSGARMSGQTWANNTGGCTAGHTKNSGGTGASNCHPPWAVAGVDYPVGVSTVGTGFASPGTATDPTCGYTGSGLPAGCTVAANFGNGTPGDTSNPGQCQYTTSGSGGAVGSPALSCFGTTSSTVDIGPIDFSYQGNSKSTYGLGIIMGPNITGPCVIHDSYFVIDMGQTYSRSGGQNIFIEGCSSITFKNDVFRIRDPQRSNYYDFDWRGQLPGDLYNPKNNAQYISVPQHTVNGMDVGLNIEYSAFLTCPERCVSTGSSVNFEHNYFDGENIKGVEGTSPFASHAGEWWMIFYNGPASFQVGAVCNCSGVDAVVENFNTWLMRNYGASAISAVGAAQVSTTAGSPLTGNVISGQTTMNVTSVNLAQLNGIMPIIGMTTFPAYFSGGFPTSPQAIITSCPGDPQQGTTNIGSIHYCNGQTGVYSFNQPFGSTTTGLSPLFDYGTTIKTGVQSNNVYVGNYIYASGAATGFCVGEGCGGPSSMTWFFHAASDNLTVTNNYVDMCGVGASDSPGGGTTNPCSVSSPPSTPDTGLNSLYLGQAYPAQNSVTEGGNVLMNTGGCFSLFTTQSSCPPF